MISKEKLTFDPAQAADGDSVGAYVLGSDGTAIDQTGGSLHVEVTSLTAADVDIRDLDAAQDNVAISDGTDTLEINADGSINATVTATDLDIRDLTFATDSVDVSGSSVTVSATDLDIRDLAFATDSVDVSGSSVSITGDVNVTQGTSPWVVSATDLDIRDLDAATDSVAAWTHDGTGNAITSSGGALDVNIQSSDIEIDVEDDKANTAILNSTASVTSTSAALLGSQQADRRFLYVQNLGNQAIYVGASGVSTSTGIRMSPGSLAEFRFGPALSLHAVANGGTQDVRLMEAS